MIDNPPLHQPVVVLGVADLMGIEMVDITKAYIYIMCA